jgi:hypothetical protein
MQRFIYLSLFIISFVELSAQSNDFWRPISNQSILQQRNQEAIYTPEKFAAFELNLTGMAKHLLSAPMEFEEKDQSFVLSLPMPDGKMRAFQVYYSAVMQEGLALKYPNIRSYKGYAVDNKSTNVRFSVGPRGFWASIHGKNNIYIDAAGENNTEQYIVYYTKDYREDISEYNLSCGMDPYSILEDDLAEGALFDSPQYPDEAIELRNTTTACDSVNLYTYRLALSCTGEWANVHGGTVESVLEDMVISVNRINQIYENEFSIRMLLIDDNDKLIWLDSETDPFPTANNGGELLSINTSVLNNNVGLNTYDIGHVFTRGCNDVGGIASVGSVCNAIRKGSAVTCHYTNNLNYIITNVTAHEMGHQFSARHTFNNCSGNETAGSDYEPGGGTTIMAYCGLCGGNNVDYNCLENFHAHSVEQIMNFSRIGGGSLCANVLASTNTNPVAILEYEDGFTIPINTPFMLEGSAYDCEGDEMTYSWEQWDLGPQVQIGNPVEDVPIFTAMEPKEVPYRIFPEMSKIINNFSNNSEILPSYTRPLNFRFIVRDNHENGGGTDWANVSFKADASAGPFRVTKPASIKTYEVGEEIEIEWDVANTNADPVNCEIVNIWLSQDAGYNYTKLLKYNTPNDGYEKVYLPNIESALVRFKVEAADNIFFDISDNYSKIVQPEEASYFIEASPIWQQICLPDVVSVALETVSFNGYQDTLRFEIASGLPEGASVAFIPEKVIPGEAVTLEIDLSTVNERALYNLEILSISTSGDSISRKVDLDVISNDYSDVEILAPIPGETGASQLINLNWTKSQSADLYNVYLSTNPSFPADETISVLNSSETSFIPDETLKKSTLYYWKIEGINECGNRPASEILTFSTEAFSCKTFAYEDFPKDIRSEKTTTLSVEVAEDTEVADLNIIRIGGDHDNFYDLDGAIVGPDDTRVDLFTSKCFQNGAVEFNFGFDDESTQKFKCPPTQGTYIPLNPLSEFIGKSAAGTWTLEIYDRQRPKGGELAIFELEICANSVLSNPYIVNNEAYQVAIGLAWDLPSKQLKVDDDDNLPEDLVYTIVEGPLYTSILKNGENLEIGDQFSEADIRNGSIQLYSESGLHGDEDSFVFTVIDGNGGWLDKTTFTFILDEDVNTENISLDQQVHLYPNPTMDKIFLNVLESGAYSVDLFDINGRKFYHRNLKGFERSSFDLSAFEPGVYYLRVQNSDQLVIKKIVKQ